MTTEKIRKDLLDIRYYYARKALFDRAANCIVENTNVERVEKFIYLPWYMVTFLTPQQPPESLKVEVDLGGFLR